PPRYENSRYIELSGAIHRRPTRDGHPTARTWNAPGPATIGAACCPVGTPRPDRPWGRRSAELTGARSGGTPTVRKPTSARRYRSATERGRYTLRRHTHVGTQKHSSTR